MSDAIYVTIESMPTIDLSLSFAVFVTGPIEMEPRVYNISMQELLSKATSFRHQEQAVREILQTAIVRNYNEMIDNSPIMDMFDNPSKYQNLYHVQFSWPTK